jgi:hypothetical protein
LLAGTGHAISKRRRHSVVGIGVEPDFMPKLDFGLIGTAAWPPTTRRVSRLTVMNEGFPPAGEQEVGPPDRKLGVRRAR